MGGVAEKALAKRLQQARLKAGLTQQQLCQKAGLSYSTLAKIERGAIASPSVFTVATIAEATGASIEDLLDIKSGSAATVKQTSKTGVKFVYFDLNNTLVHGYEKVFPKLAKLSGLPLDTVESVYWRYDDEACSGQISLEEFNKTVGQKLGLADFDWTASYLEVVEAIPGVKELVDWAAQHYEIGLLTGTTPGALAGLERKGELPLAKFSQVIDSSEVKLLKDSPEIYKLAQSRAGHQPHEILLIDDDKTAIVQADRAGWQICRFNPYNPEESIARAKQHLEF